MAVRMKCPVITLLCLLVCTGIAEDAVKSKNSGLQRTKNSKLDTSHPPQVFHESLMPTVYKYTKDNYMHNSDEDRQPYPMPSIESPKFYTQRKTMQNTEKLSDTNIKIQKDHDIHEYNTTILKRNKREAEETEILKDESSNDEVSEPEALPEAESLIWARPARIINQGIVRNVNTFTHIPSQLPINYQNRQSQRNIDPTPSYGNRPRPGHIPGISSKPNLNQLINSVHKQDPYSSSTGYGSSHGINNPPRQYHNNEYPSTPPYPSGPRFREISSYPQHNSYPISTYPPRGYGGGSIFDLLNPLNLFRMQLPPALPRNPNPVPPPNSVPNSGPPPNLVPPHSGYDLRQLRQPPKRPIPNNSFEGRNPSDFDYAIDYEIVEEDFEHDYGHEYWKESNLRDDIYVGKDGNLYIQEKNTGKRGNSGRPNQSGDNRRPFSRPSYSKPNRPGISNPRDRIDDDDNNNVHNGKTVTEGEAIYEDLLRNHNMQEQKPKEVKKPVEEYYDENLDSYESLSHNLNTLLDYEDYNDYDDSINHVQTATTRLTHPSAAQSWTPSRPRLINYPSYYYSPKQISIHSLNRARPWRTLTAPRRRAPLITSVRQTRPTPSRSPQLLHSTSQLSPNYANIALLNSNTETGYKDRGKNSRTQTPSQTESSRIRDSDGFYPGNGFFDADFQTLFNMASSQRRRGSNPLPTPLAQNGTTVALLNSTVIDSWKTSTTAVDLS